MRFIPELFTFITISLLPLYGQWYSVPTDMRWDETRSLKGIKSLGIFVDMPVYHIDVPPALRRPGGNEISSYVESTLVKSGYEVIHPELHDVYPIPRDESPFISVKVWARKSDSTVDIIAYSVFVQIEQWCRLVKNEPIKCVGSTWCDYSLGITTQSNLHRDVMDQLKSKIASFIYWQRKADQNAN